MLIYIGDKLRNGEQKLGIGDDFTVLHVPICVDIDDYTYISSISTMIQ